MIKKQLLFILALIACLVPVGANALSVNLSLFSGGLSVLDSLFLISVGLILIGVLLMCIAYLKPEKQLAAETEDTGTADSEKTETESETDKAADEEQPEQSHEAEDGRESEAAAEESTSEDEQNDSEDSEDSENGQDSEDSETSEDAQDTENNGDGAEETAAEINITLTLTGVKNGELKVLPIAERAVIGRSMRNDVVITDSTVSGIHCEFTYEDGKLYLTDKNSTNGTYLNEERIIEKTEVHKGDILEIGRNKFKIGL